MVAIIGRGQENDPSSLMLYTSRNRNRIPNEIPEEEKNPAALKAARRLHEEMFNAKCRSMTGMYNCVGMVFASRRTSIDSKYIDRFLGDDFYKLTTEKNLHAGDVVVYRNDQGAPQHVGIVYEIRSINILDPNAGSDIWILSQWGYDGEFRHRVRSVPSIFGSRIEYWTERREFL